MKRNDPAALKAARKSAAPILTVRQNQKKLAQTIDVSASFICDILHERKMPSPKKAVVLETKTGIPLRAWLFPDQYYNPFIHEVLGDDYSFMKRRMTHQK